MIQENAIFSSLVVVVPVFLREQLSVTQVQSHVTQQSPECE